jgi:hypothetical protein
MKQLARLGIGGQAIALMTVLTTLAGRVLADQVRTNLVERWITNTIEIYVPANHIVNEFHTNVVVRTQTNIVNLYLTNVVTRHATNQIYVESIRTNFVAGYQTNYKTFNVTNWTTLLVLKTNWVQQTVTNVAEVDIARAEPARAVSVQNPPLKAPQAASSGAASDVLTMEASRGTRPAPANYADVSVTAHWSRRPGTEVLVQQWRVQSQEGSILCFGQENEFRRTLPFGQYKVELKARFEPNSPVITIRGLLNVKAREVTLDQHAFAKR